MVRICALAPALACGLAAHTDVGPGFDWTSPEYFIRSASHRTGNLAGTAEKSGAVGEPLVRWSSGSSPLELHKPATDTSGIPRISLLLSRVIMSL